MGSRRLLRDDGAVVYLNSNEVFRSNMPGGVIGYRTLASAAVGGGDELAWYSTNVSPARLTAGLNVLAVEIHQNSTNSSDLGFDLEFLGVAPPPVPPLSLNLEPGALRLAWPASGALILETTTNLSPVAVWPNSAIFSIRPACPS